MNLLRVTLDRFGGDRNRKLAVSIIASIGTQLVSLGAPVLLMPAMLAYLGDVAFGIWAASVSFTSITAFLDLGIGSGLLSRLSAAGAHGDTVTMRRYIASAYLVLGTISIVGLLALVVASIAGANSFFSAPNAWSITAAVLASFFIGMPAVVSYRLLYALQKIPLQSVMQSLGAIASVIVCLATIHYRSSPWLVVLAYSGTPVLTMILTTFGLFSRWPALLPRAGDFSFRRARELINFGSSFFLLAILTAVGMNSDILIISAVAGPEAVAHFVPPSRIGSILGLLIIQLFMPLWTFNGEALARGDVEWVRRTTKLMSLAGTALIFVCGAILVLASDRLMLLWVHRVFENQALVLACMCALSATMAFTSPYNMVLNAKGLAGPQILPWLAFVLTSVGLKLVVIPREGAWTAPALSFVCYLLILSPAMVRRARRALT